MDYKTQSKLILKQHPEIIKAYILFFVAALTIILPELLLKTAIKLLASGIHFKWLKLITYFINLPVALTTQILLVLLLFAVNYYIFLKASGRQTSIKEVLKGFKIRTVLKFILTLLYSAGAFLLCQIPTLLLGILYATYSTIKLVTNFHLPLPVLIIYFSAIIFTFVFFTVLFIKRFSLVLYLFLYDTNQPFLKIIQTNKYISKTYQHEFSTLLKSYLSSLLLSAATLGIYLFYTLPSFQISLILFVQHYTTQSSYFDF